ncbi:MAG: ABC transporter permease [Treponema sp.]|jgi:simple sugar transport system permease protein|nr:ABC transporter permease [Treponema sp.]
MSGKLKLPGIFRQNNEITKLLIMLIFAYILMAMLNPSVFVTRRYTVSMLYLFPEYGVLSLAMMLSMISGGIDLSIVAVANLAGISSCMFLVAVMPREASTPATVGILVLAIVFALLIGLICGACSAFLIAKIGIPPMLATLGSGDLILGLAIAITKGSSVKGLPPILSDVFNKTLIGILPITTVDVIICSVVISYILAKTAYGYKVRMMGSNAVAARYAGIDTGKTTFQTYMMGGMLAAVSGILMCSRFNSARSDFGTSYTLQAILVCVLAGINPQGGYGKTRGIVLAVFILQILSSGFNMFPGVSNFFRNLIWGLVLLLVIIFNHISHQKLHSSSPASFASSPGESSPGRMAGSSGDGGKRKPPSRKRRNITG